MTLKIQDYVVLGAGALGAAWYLSAGEPEVTYYQDADGQIIATTADENDVLTYENMGHTSGVRIYTDKNGAPLCAIGNEPCAITPPELRFGGPGL